MEVLLFAVCGLIFSVINIFNALAGVKTSDTLYRTSKIASIAFLVLGIIGGVYSFGLFLYAMMVK